MKKNIPLLIIVFLIVFQNCNQTKIGDNPQTIVLAGKIDNYDPNWQVIVGVNKIGLVPELMTAKTDIAGNFVATFESYVPLDVSISYKTFFWVLLHPGDSLFVKFDGKCNDRFELLKTVDFKGDADMTNRYAAIFQKMYFSNEIYYDWDKKRRAVKEYDVDQYLQYLDTLRQKNKNIYNQFVAENHPDDESKKWAKLFSEKDYYHYLGWYANNRRQMNLDHRWKVPKGFYDSLCTRLPIEPSMLIGAYLINDFSEVFEHYVNDRLKDRETGFRWFVSPEGKLDGSPAIVDSIQIFGTIEFVSDPLLRQIMLTMIFDRHFEKRNIAVYEQYLDVANKYIMEPFLKEPLTQKYLRVKQKIENCSTCP